ncbi:metal ABC transporter solute-binding protein, Zn/Mn family [Planctomicrobium sp. SH527]|uniref:metal ABC transporter solute-binding protein, Zn/Mn family n=1 Tax=Planctomicrobium sp. SH527 TaxID=3448123 RepID=UPI003F5C12E9
MLRHGLLLVVLFGLFGCPASSSVPSGPESSALKIVATTSMVADLVRNVAGEHGDVVELIGEGVDPHLYRPTASDVSKMMKADVLFYSGLALEGAMETAFQNAARRGSTVVAVTDQLPKELLRFPDGGTTHPDPHVWNAPGIWLQCLDRIAEVLAEKDPENAAVYRQRAANYQERLKLLDRYASESVESIPVENRFLVTAHDAFGYFSHVYKLEEHSVQGISTESEPGVQDINNLVDFLVKRRVPALFVEATVNSGSLKAVIERTKQNGWEVKLGGTLYSDSMGAPGTAAGTYSGMIEHNVNTIVAALNGKVPEGGFEAYLKANLPAPNP